MKPPKNKWIWPLVIVFLIFPVVVTWSIPIHMGDDAHRAVAIVLLTFGLLLGTASAGFFILALARIAMRQSKPVRMSSLTAETRSIVLCAGFLAGAITVLLAVESAWLALVYVLLISVYLAYTVPASRRMIDYSVATTVRCAPESAFALIADPRTWPQFHPDISLEVLEPIDSPLRVGSVVRERVRIGRTVVAGEDAVTVVEPGRRLGMSARSSPGRSDDLYEFKPSNGGTEITYTYHSLMTVPTAVGGGVLNRRSSVRFLSARRALVMERIKRVLESAPSPAV